MKPLLSVIIAWANALAIFAGEIDLPAEIKGKVGRPLFAVAKTESKKIEWRTLDTGLDVISAEYLRDSKVFGASSVTPGRFRVLAIGVHGDEPCTGETVFVFEGDAPQPGPGPTPPGPAPAPDFQSKLQAAYSADAAPIAVRNLQRASLSGLYTAMVEHSASKDVKRLDALLEDAKALSKQMVPPGVLIEVRKVIAAEVAAQLGDGPETELTDALRDRAKSTFARISSALDALK